MLHFITTKEYTTFVNYKLTTIPEGTLYAVHKIPLTGEEIFVSLYNSLTGEQGVKNVGLLKPYECKIKYVHGDLLKDAANYDSIIHGCNCFNTMGGGIAAGVAKIFPEATKIDAETERGSKAKLGKFTHVVYPNYQDKGDLTVINAYTQFYPGAAEPDQSDKKSIEIREWAIRKSMRRIKESFSGKKFALPLLGAGIAGGSWERIEKIILEELIGEDITIVLWGHKDDNNLLKSMTCFEN